MEDYMECRKPDGFMEEPCYCYWCTLPEEGTVDLLANYMELGASPCQE